MLTGEHTDIIMNYTDLSTSSNLSQLENMIVDTNLRKVARYLDYYFVPCIIATGLIGNTLSFVVFVYTDLKKLSSSVYLAGLAISDNGFLICVFFSWSNNVDIKLYHKPGWCQSFVYMTYVFGFLSVWYIVVFSCERFIAVKWPFKRSEICTPRKAKFMVIFLAVLAAVMYSFAIWTSEVTMWYNTPICMPKHKYKTMIEKLNGIDSVITLVIPFVTILFFNTGIICSLKNFTTNYQHWQFQRGAANSPKSHDLRSTVRSRSDSSSSSSAKQSEKCNTMSMATIPTNTDSSARRTVRPVGTLSHTSSNSSMGIQRTQSTRHSQLHVTKMLLVVSSIFLLLNVPSHVIRIYDFFEAIANKNYITSLTIIRWQKIFTYVYYVNFAINFILYSLCGKNFRKALVGLAKKVSSKLCGRKYNRNNTQITVRSIKSVDSTHV